MEQTKRIRLNQEYRNKIAKRIELGLDQEHTIQKEKYLQLREQIKPLQDKTWNLMYEIGRENYPQEDVDMATVNGAKVFNLNCGEIKEGKLADLLLIDLKNIGLLPRHNLISNLVYSANGSCVDTTICNGKILMQNRKVVGEEEILEKANEIAMKLTK